MRWSRPLLALGYLILAIFIDSSVTPISGAAPNQQLTVYAAQASYSLPIADRGGRPYIAVTDLLSPLGASSPQLKNKEWRLELNQGEARFTEGKDKASIRGHQVDLG